MQYICRTVFLWKNFINLFYLCITLLYLYLFLYSAPVYTWSVLHQICSPICFKTLNNLLMFFKNKIIKYYPIYNYTVIVKAKMLHTVDIKFGDGFLIRPAWDIMGHYCTSVEFSPIFPRFRIRPFRITVYCISFSMKYNKHFLV